MTSLHFSLPVTVRVARLGNKSMERGTQLTVGEDEVVVGHMVQVAYDYAAHRSIPPEWREKIRAFESGEYQFPLSQTKIICLYS